MSAGTNATAQAAHPGRIKPGGNLSGFRPHQGSAAHMGVQPKPPGGSESSTLIRQFNLAVQEYAQELDLGKRFGNP